MENITELVEKTGLTRQELARSLGVSVAMLRNYERGHNAIPDQRLGTLKALAGGHVAPGQDAAPVAPKLAMVPAVDLIRELDRRAAAGQLRDTITRPGTSTGPSGAVTRLRAVASDMTDTEP